MNFTSISIQNKGQQLKGGNEVQKNYRDFTVGELLDMGLKVQVNKYSIDSEEEGKALTRMFEGTKQSTRQINKTLKTINGWKGNFEVTAFLRTDEKEEMK